MSSGPKYLLSRRAALAGLTTTAISGSIPRGAAAENSAGPVFSPSGPDAERYGAARGFPAPDAGLARQQGNPCEPGYRVGVFSHFDEIYPTRPIKCAATPWSFKHAQADMSDSF